MRFIFSVCLLLCLSVHGVVQGQQLCSRGYVCSEAVLNPDNGHYYIWVGTTNFPEATRGWETANEYANSHTYQGMPGYLATLTSAAELEFARQHFNDRGESWLGGSDRDVEGDWRWVTGPEAGELFWSQGTTVTFASWAIGEPNDEHLDFGEDYLAFYRGVVGWNDFSGDLNNSVIHGQLIEFSPVPEPSSYALATIGLIGMAGVIRQRKRR
jgi:hypothetical protein